MCLDIHPTCYSVKAYLLSAVFKNKKSPTRCFLLEICYAICIVKNSFIPLLIIGLLFSASFGLVMSMRTDAMGQMSDCPFSHGEALCQMGVFEHLDRFQQAFASIPVKVIVLTFLISLIWFSSDNKTKVFYQNSRLLYLKSIRELSNVFDDFLLALSDGIVQPKLYA